MKQVHSRKPRSSGLRRSPRLLEASGVAQEVSSRSVEPPIRRNEAKKPGTYYSEVEEDDERSEAGDSEKGSISYTGSLANSRQSRSAAQNTESSASDTSFEDSAANDDNDSEVSRVSEVQEEVRAREKEDRNSSRTTVLDSGDCPKCGRYYKGLKHHVLWKHQGQFTADEAGDVGLKICKCGRLCKTLALHWVKSCPLPPEEQGQITREDEGEVERPSRTLEATIPRPSTSKIQHFFCTLRDDVAKDEDRRADLCVSVEVTDGKVCLNVHVVLVVGTAASQVVAAFVPPFVNTTDDNVVQCKHREIPCSLNARDRRKKRQHAGQDYGGRLQTFLLTTGGTLHRDTIKFLTRLKQLTPRLHERLKYELSVHLARCQARCFYACFVPRRRRQHLD